MCANAISSVNNHIDDLMASEISKTNESQIICRFPESVCNRSIVRKFVQLSPNKYFGMTSLLKARVRQAVLIVLF